MRGYLAKFVGGSAPKCMKLVQPNKYETPFSNLGSDFPSIEIRNY